MFKKYPTGTKLFLLCSAFIVAIVAAIYEIVVEKRIAIEFARKELIGTHYLDTLRNTYAAILTERDSRSSVEQPTPPETALLEALSSAEARASGALNTAELQISLVTKLQALWSTKSDDVSRDVRFQEALAAARMLALRISDDSNLTLDPDLDSYYLQDTVVSKLPSLLSQLGEARSLVKHNAAPDLPFEAWYMRFLVLDGLIRSTMDAIAANLAAAARAHPDGSLQQVVGTEIEVMAASTSAYLNAVGGDLGGGEDLTIAVSSPDQVYASAVQSAVAAWGAVQTELDRLLRIRIDGLLDKLYRSLMVTGALTCVSIAIALMTHRHIVRPLKQLENVARTVRETKDYSRRSDQSGEDEIGRLAVAFDDMLSELAAAREREVADQARNAKMHAELARAARFATMGEMAASIAHEINQPLAAIVTSGNAGLRWIAHATPNLDEARAALKRIVSDGHRASQVIKSVRAMFRDQGHEKTAVVVNDLIKEVMALVHSELQNQQVLVKSVLDTGLPNVSADRVQLQHVLLNLIGNAADAMASLIDRPRVLLIKSRLHEGQDILITVADSGPGIDPQHIDRIFEAFFTTKSDGMGMGLSICRSIVEAHGGRLWAASTETPHGSVFSIILPGKAIRE